MTNFPQGQIFHFDATEIRRIKMRNAASGAVKEQKSLSSESQIPEAPILKAVDDLIVPFKAAPAPVQVAPVPVEPQKASVLAIDAKQLESLLINFVVEQTGYPEEMVEMDADLEGDLGIDSIKKAQLIGELNEQFHFVDVSAPTDENMSLDDFPTLASIRDYLLSKMGGSTVAAKTEESKTDSKPEPQQPVAEPVKPEIKPAVSANISGPSKAELESLLINFVVEQTGYPEEMVEMDADLEGDLGIDSIKKAQLIGELNEQFHFVDVSAPTDENMSLDDFPTLASIRDYLLSKMGGSTVAAKTEESKTESKPEPQQPVAEPVKPEIKPAVSANISGPSKAELESLLINFVVEQTGYPEEMVEMDADLEGDLGIDSIKKAQLIGELNEQFHFVDVSAPTDENMSLDDFPTLASIRDYLLSKMGTTTAAKATEAAPESSKALALEKFLINFVVEQTGYPESMVSLDANLQNDLNIDSIKKAQLFGELFEQYDLIPLMDMSLEDFTTLRDILNACMKENN